LNPTGAGPYQYNLWRSWGVRPNPTGDDTLIMRYIREVPGKRQPRRAEALLRLLAYAVQHPGRRWNVALFLSGPQGTGKTTLPHIMNRIFGPHAYVLDTIEDLFASFNGGLLGKCFISVEEGASGTRADIWNRLKPFITSDTIAVTEKYRPTITIPNMTHLIVTTNEPQKLKIDRDDRRCWVFDVERTWDRAEFTKLYDSIADDGAVGAFLHRLLTLDIKGFDPQADRPMTEALAHVKELSFTPEETLIRDWLQQGRIAGRSCHTLEVELYGLRVPKSETLSAYQLFMRAEHRGKLVLGRNHWYKRLGEMLAGAIHEDKPCGTEREFIIPDLTEARQAFERYFGQPLEWEEPSEVEDQVFEGHR
jgi:hypothetical protein